VAKATALLDRGRPWKSLYPSAAGEVKAWSRFKKDFKFTPILIECYLRDHEREIKGQLDRRGVSKYGMITVEIKLYEWKSWHALQLADYEYMAEGCPEDLDSTDRRWVITLYPDGTYGQKKFDDPNDLRIFLAAASHGPDHPAVFAWLNTHRR
jgi:hypothetical protein